MIVMIKKKGKILLIVLVLVGILAAGVYYQLDGGNTNKAITYEGYLIDEHCLANKKGIEETVKCLQMVVCEKSGYGVAVDNGGEKEKFIKFDESGHKLAKELVDKATSDKLNKIIVKGYYEDGKFIVETIDVK